MLRQIGDKDQKIQNLEALLQKSKDIVSQLEAEREDLCAKIQAGEGETALLSQLKEKNHALQEQVGAHTPSKVYFYFAVTSVQCKNYITKDAHHPCATKKCSELCRVITEKTLVIVELTSFFCVLGS